MGATPEENEEAQRPEESVTKPDPDDQPVTEHLGIKVATPDQEVYFKIKKSTPLRKLMDAFCQRSGKAPNSVRFLYEGDRIQPTCTPEELEMEDGDTIDVMAEQVGGALALL